MKVLVATRETQGQRKSDFCFAIEGELVEWAFECDRDEEDIDGDCGCRRSLTGIVSRKGTTTMAVVERTITLDELAGIIRENAESAGIHLDIDVPHDLAEYVVEMAAEFPVGTVVERRGDEVLARRPAFIQ